MPFHQPDDIRFFTFDSLDQAGLVHAVFTRRGGVSPEPWASLNVGGLRGDDPARVLQNRVLSFNTLGRIPESVYDVWQVHSAEVICTNAPRANLPHRKADAILTDRPEVTLFMRFGDCVPILLHDPVKNIVGIAHAGWQGTVKKTVVVTVEAMQACYGSLPGDILASIGPSIAAHHYQVGSEVIDQINIAFNEYSESILKKDGAGATSLDLWEANRLLLEQAGVRQVEIAGMCTACHPEDWYSHRRDAGLTGRFGVLIALNKG
jgi:YfiH family protein